MKVLVEQIVKARKVGVPIVAVGTPDQFALVDALAAAVRDRPLLVWDCARGLRAGNKLAEPVLAALPQDAMQASNIPIVLMKDLAPKLPVIEDGRVFLVAMNLQKFLGEPEVAQAVANIRDPFKKKGCTLVLLSRSVSLPGDLEGDAIRLEDPLPDDDGYSAIATRVQAAAELKAIQPPAALVPAVRGLSAFVAEQVLAMSVDTAKRVLEPVETWRLKREAINAVDGLSMTLDGPALGDVVGLDQLVSALVRIFAGPKKPECILLLDEIEKMMAGLGQAGGPGDNTGVTQDALMNLLTAMEGWGWSGAILVGVPGGGKTMLGEAIGAAHGVPLIKLDLGATKKKHVGESEESIRDAMRAIHNVGKDRVFVIATCNQIASMPPELQSRFKLGTWYIDTPGADERAAIASVYLRRFGFPADTPMPNTTGWTGREIRNVCEVAQAMAISPKDAADFIVPIARANPQSVDQLRQLAHGRFLSAANPGVYDRNEEGQGQPTGARAFES